MLRALLQQGAGLAFPQQIALGLMFDPDAARMACAAGVGAQLELSLGKAVPIFTSELSDPPVQGRFTVRGVSEGACLLKGPMMKGSTIQMGPSACLEIDGIYIAVASGKMQMLDRELFRTVGIHPEKMKVVVVKSSNHFRADFTPIASHVLIAKAPGPMAADPGDLPWKKLSPQTRTRP
jgi:microcystin degradation protein MlrC